MLRGFFSRYPLLQNDVGFTYLGALSDMNTNDSLKTKDQLIAELEELRAQVSEHDGAATEAAAATPAPQVAAPWQRSEADRPLVLIVEDDPDMRDYLRAIVGQEYRVATAEDGQEGLEQALALRPDLILSDIMMPRMSGDQLVREVRARPELGNVPLVLLTAKHDDDLHVRLLREGAQDYLTKPFPMEEMRARLGNQIATKRARDLLQKELDSQSHDLEALAAEVSLHKRGLESSLAAARRSKELYIALTKNFSHDAVLMFDKELNFLVAESAGVAGIGFSSDALEGHSIWEVFPAATCQVLERRFRAALAGTATTFEVPYGNSTYRMHALPVRNESGDIFAGMAVVQDINERKHDEWNQFQATILAQVSDAVNAIDNKHRIIYWNHASERLYGISSDDVLGRTLEEIYDYVWLKPEDFQAARRALDGNGSWQGENIHRIKHSGAEIHVEASISRLLDRNGEPSGYLAVIRDVTGRKRAEQELEKNNQTLRALFRTSPLGIVTLDRDFTVTMWNPRAERIFGWSEGEMLGRPLPPIPGDTEEAVSAACRLVLGGSAFASFETRYRKPDGTILEISIATAPLRDGDGAITGVMAVVGDITERKRADQAVRRSEARFRGVVESDMIGIIFWDANGNITEANDAFLRMVGYTRDDLRAGKMRWSDMTPPEYADLDRKGLEEISATGICAPFEKQYLAKDGRRVPILIGAASLDASTDHGVCFVLDITENKEAEKERLRLLDQLGSERALLETVLRQMPSGVLIVDAESGKIILSNEQFERVWHQSFPVGEEILRFKRQGFHPDGRPYQPEEWPVIRAIRTGELVTNEEVEILRSDGTRATLNINAALVRDSEGRIVAGIAISYDITERRRAEVERTQLLAREHAAREQSEAAQRRLSLLAEASSELASSLDYEATLTNVARLAVPHLADWCIVDLIDKEGAVQRVAAAHRDPAKASLVNELRRYPPDMHKAVSVSKVLHTGQPELGPSFSEAQLQEIAVDAEHLDLLRQLGLKSHMCVPLLAHGRILGAMTFSTAQHDRRYGPDDLSLAQELARRAALAVDNARLYHELQESSRAKDEFLSILSHELRTPLTSIYGWTCMLKEDDLDEEFRTEALDTIEQCANTQMQLISDLLDVSRIISGKLRLHVHAVEIAPVVATAVDNVRPAAEAKSIRIEAHIEPVGPVTVDASRIQQIVWNLVSNAVKFTPYEGRVEVHLDRDDSGERPCARIRVRDTGQGISAEFLPHVFDRFRQADSANTRAHGGLGMGLALVRDLVEMHGGTVRVESGGSGQGATFSICLPLAAEELAGPAQPGGAPGDEASAESASPASVANPSSSTLSGVRVLLVDDDDDARKLFTVVLTRSGAVVQRAASAAAAMEILERWQPDVLVSDIGMPGEDGYALIRRVRAYEERRGGKIPAIALTAHVTTEARIRALRAGFQVHLSKPVEPDELAASVASLAALTAKH